MSSDAFLDWFAGFAAGEGCFRLAYNARDNSFQARFHICLRDDDLPILLAIQETLKIGNIYRAPRPHRHSKYGYISNPQATWQVDGTDSLLQLMKIFEAHPLRNRKQEEFEAWKEALVEIARGMRRGNEKASYDRKRLSFLRDKILLIRGYETAGDEEPEYNGGHAQLELPWP